MVAEVEMAVVVVVAVVGSQSVRSCRALVSAVQAALPLQRRVASSSCSAQRPHAACISVSIHAPQLDQHARLSFRSHISKQHWSKQALAGRATTASASERARVRLWTVAAMVG
eukprot:1858132-Rhodomonas_salina.2